MKKCIVTGANGLLGKALVTLLSKTHIVYSVSRFTETDKKNNVISLKLDLAGNWSESELPDSIDFVYLLAQSNHHKNTYDNSIDIFDINIRSVFRFIDYYSKKKVKKIIIASSGGVYKESLKSLYENCPLKDSSDIYIMSKLCEEFIANTYSKFTEIAVLRPFFIYGPGQKNNFLISKLVNTIRLGKPVQIEGKEGIKLNPIYVKDAAMVFYRAAELKGSYKVNVGGKEVLSIKKIAEIIGEIIGIKPVFQFQNKSKQTNIIGDISFMEKELYKPKYSFKSALVEFIKNEKI